MKFAVAATGDLMRHGFDRNFAEERSPHALDRRQIGRTHHKVGNAAVQKQVFLQFMTGLGESGLA